MICTCCKKDKKIVYKSERMLAECSALVEDAKVYKLNWCYECSMFLLKALIDLLDGSNYINFVKRNGKTYDSRRNDIDIRTENKNRIKR